MIEYPVFHFQGFTLRAAVDADLPLAEAWTAADPDHRGRVNPSFWVENTMQVNSFLLLDAVGPVFFFRIDRDLGPREVCRVRVVDGEEIRTIHRRAKSVTLHIQFPPNDARGCRLRTMQGMAIGFDWLKKILGEAEYDAVYFTSKNQRLIHFATERLGFFVESSSGDDVRVKAYLEREAETESV